MFDIFITLPIKMSTANQTHGIWVKHACCSSTGNWYLCLNVEKWCNYIKGCAESACSECTIPKDEDKRYHPDPDALSK